MARYANEKGNLRFPLDEPIPYRVIERIVKPPTINSSFVRTYVGTGEPRERAATVRVSSNLSQKEKPMRPAATRPDGAMVPTLCLAFELGNTEWQLGLTMGAVSNNPRSGDAELLGGVGAVFRARPSCFAPALC
jgi:hypothetical protein